MKRIRKVIQETNLKALDDGVYEATISNESVDREGDIIRSSGWNLDNYLKNPVVLWAHRYDTPPIGKTVNVWVDEESNSLKTQFVFAETEEAQKIKALYDGGFMSAFSVGFDPHKWEPIEGTYGREYLGQELLEYSAVPVPANAEALVAARSKGLDVDFLIDALDPLPKSLYEKLIETNELLTQVIASQTPEPVAPKDDGDAPVSLALVQAKLAIMSRE